jgi:thiosulfate/3-mercaptopyruvate sulfurtransferase
MFKPRPNPDWIASKQDVVAALDRDDTVIIDCLTPELYEGRGERHQWGQRKGHIPGAVNVPFRANIDPALTTTAATDRERLLASDRSFAFSDPEALAALYGAAGVTPKHEVITYCGLGYAASCGLLALKILGQEQVRLYDGSWEEWSADPDLPAEVSR